MSDIDVRHVRASDMSDVDAIMQDSVSGKGQRPFQYTQEDLANAESAVGEHMERARAYKIGIEALDQFGDHAEAQAQRDWNVVGREVVLARIWNHYAIFVRSKLRELAETPKQAVLL